MQYTEESAKKRLQEKFDRDYGLDMKGTAFIHVSVIGNDGTQYGSFKRISEKSLCGRQIEYVWRDYAPAIIVLDSTFEPRGCKWSNPLAL